MSDDRRELVPIALALGQCEVGTHFFVSSGQVRPLGTRRRVGVDGPGWEAQVRARHQDRQWRKVNGLGLEPRTRESGATARRSGASEPVLPRLALSGPSLRPGAAYSARRRRIGRAALLCLVVLAFILARAFMTDVALATALLAIGTAMGLVACISELAQRRR